MAKFQCQLIRQLLSCTLNSQENSKDLVSAIKQTPGLLVAVRGWGGPEGLGTPKQQEASWLLFGGGAARKVVAPRSNRKLAGRCSGPKLPGSVRHPKVTGSLLVAVRGRGARKCPAPRSNRKLAGCCAGQGRPGRPWGPEVTGSLLDAVRGRGGPEGRGAPK